MHDFAEIAETTFGPEGKYVAANDNIQTIYQANPRSIIGPNLIGITGKAGAGKTTASRYMVRKYGYEIRSLAAPLKSMIDDLLFTAGVSHTDRLSMVYGDKKEATSGVFLGKTTRHAMQTLGTEWGRACMGEEFWLNLWWRSIAGEGNRQIPLVICDDVRFPNEADYIRSKGGRILRITGRGDIAGGHASEKQDFFADRAIENTGTVEELYSALDDLIADWAVNS